jgi:signal peptidase II
VIATNSPGINKAKFILPFALLLLCVALDQWIKVYVKTNFVYSEIRPLFGQWFKLYFIENNGMAFGLEWGGKAGKLLLTGFRLAVSAFGAWYLWHNMRKGSPMGLLLSIALIMAGAVGNIIDSVFYGVWFNKINAYDGGYFQGHVVDMFYAPIYQGQFPSWFPFWKNEPFVFFSPIWNLADACITVGVAIIVIGQKRFFAGHHPYKTESELQEADTQVQETELPSDGSNPTPDTEPEISPEH